MIFLINLEFSFHKIHPIIALEKIKLLVKKYIQWIKEFPFDMNQILNTHKIKLNDLYKA